MPGASGLEYSSGRSRLPVRQGTQKRLLPLSAVVMGCMKAGGWKPRTRGPLQIPGAPVGASALLRTRCNHCLQEVRILEYLLARHVHPFASAPERNAPSPARHRGQLGRCMSHCGFRPTMRARQRAQSIAPQQRGLPLDRPPACMPVRQPSDPGMSAREELFRPAFRGSLWSPMLGWSIIASACRSTSRGQACVKDRAREWHFNHNTRCVWTGGACPTGRES